MVIYLSNGFLVMDWNLIADWVLFDFDSSGICQPAAGDFLFDSAVQGESSHYIHGSKAPMSAHYMLCGMLVVSVILAWKTPGGSQGNWI